MEVVDPLGIFRDVFKKYGRSGVESLLSAMKKLEKIDSPGRLSSFKRLKGLRHVWEYRAGSLRFYFYVRGSTALLISFSTKDRQKEAIENISKSIEKIKEILDKLGSNFELLFYVFRPIAL